MSDPRKETERDLVTFELFVQSEYSEVEAALVISTLKVANQIQKSIQFEWAIVSDAPGLVKGNAGGMMRASPAIADHNLANWMVVVGGDRVAPLAWMKRIRSMTRLARTSVLLSDAATCYIRESKNLDGAITTHWMDVSTLEEVGYYPHLTMRLSERSGSVITSAGRASTADLMLGILDGYLPHHEIVDIANHLIIHNIRPSQMEQPLCASNVNAQFYPYVTQAINIMEENIVEPFSIADVCIQIGVSPRQLERSFKKILGMPPSQYYKRLRLKRAYALLERTQLRVNDIAFATGFHSSTSLSKAFRNMFNETPTQFRAKNRQHILEYGVDAHSVG